MTGYAYVFLRPDGAALLVGDAGHVRWGFQLESGQYYTGSTENEAGHPVVPPGGDNGWWAEREIGMALSEVTHRRQTAKISQIR